MDYAAEIARIGLKINAIKLRPDNPFTWASGFKMPIYNDNRMFLFYPEYRDLLAKGFEQIMQSKNISCDINCGDLYRGDFSGNIVSRFTAKTDDLCEG